MKTGEIVVKYFVTHTYYQIVLQWHNQATWEKIRYSWKNFFSSLTLRPNAGHGFPTL